MEASTSLIEQTAEEQPTEPVAVSATARKMFKYSEFLDVGEGAAECPHARSGECEDPEHFHAWCRLPNPYQHKDIREKGLAAKAMRIRLLRDPNSSASIVLDVALKDIDDPIYVETIIDELLATEWAEDYLEARNDVEEREEFEHIAQEREEFERQREQQEDLTESEQSEEFRLLTAQIDSYLSALRERMKEIQEPKREDYRKREFKSILALVRSKRVEEEADRAFIDAYNAWMWFVGTYKVALHPALKRPHLPMWTEIGQADRASAGTMFGEAPEVIEALKATYNRLQLALAQGSSGN